MNPEKKLANNLPKGPSWSGGKATPAAQPVIPAVSRVLVDSRPKRTQAPTTPAIESEPAHDYNAGDGEKQLPESVEYSEAELSNIRRQTKAVHESNFRANGMGTVHLTERPEPFKYVAPDPTKQELARRLTVSDKVADSDSINVCVKHLRILELDEKLRINPDSPGTRLHKVSAGIIRKALDEINAN